MPKKILLADDSVTIQKVVSITLSSEDYDLTIVGDGEAALQKIREEKPDLVIVDVAMPRRNGYDVCEAVKKDPELKNIPVLLLSGTFEPLNEDEARRVGADDHIAKPFESQEFLDKVKTLLERPAAPAPQEATPTIEPLEEAGEETWGAADFLGPVEEGSEEPFKLDTDFLGGVAFDEAQEQGGGEEGFVDLKIEEEEKKEDTTTFDLGPGPSESVPQVSEQAVEEPSLEESREPAGVEAPEDKARAETPETVAPEEPEPQVQPEGFSFEGEPLSEPGPEEAHAEAPAGEQTSPQEPEFEIERPDGFTSWPEQAVEDITPEPVSEEAPKRPSEEEKPLEPLAEEREERPLEPEPEPSKTPEVEEVAAPQGLKQEGGDRAVEATAAEMLPREELEEIVKKTTREVIEQIAWEIIPEMAEEFIKSEFEKIREAIAKAR